MKLISRFLSKYKKQAFLAPGLKLLEALMDLLVPLVVAQIIDRGIYGHDTAFVRWMFVLLIVFGFVGMAFSFAAQWFAAQASVGVACDIRQALFDRVQRFSYTELDTVGTDTLITRMTSDVNLVQNGLNLALRLLLRSPFIVLGAMIMAFTIDVKSALIFACALPVLSLIVFGIMNRSIPLFAKAQKALDRLLGKTRENLSGARVVRAFCKEKDEIDAFDEANRSVNHLNLQVGRLNALMNPGTYLVINLATIALIYLGARRVDSGFILQGDLVALYNYMAQIVVELIKLASLIISINKALACAGRIENVLTTESSMFYPTAAKAPTTGDGTAVRFEDVTFSYKDSGASALEHISFTVLSGETVGIIGGTGSGKTTLVGLIPRFYDVSEGRVCVDGRDVREYGESELNEKIAVVPQAALLFAGSIRDNMKWGKSDASDDEILSALDTAQALEIVQNKPGALDYAIEQGGRNLSGGQRQRLTIARALVKRVKILILDDSASALDFATDLKLRQALRTLGGETTVFIVSQRAASVRHCDRILVLNDGRLVGNAGHEQLLKENAVYREIYYSQFPEERGISA